MDKVLHEYKSFYAAIVPMLYNLYKFSFILVAYFRNILA